jgi:hypothetical protein
MNLEKRESSDFHRKEGFVKGLKRPDQVIHERLAERPFVPLASVDVKKLIDMGQRQYSYDYGLPGKGHECEESKKKPAGGGGKIAGPPKP